MQISKYYKAVALVTVCALTAITGLSFLLHNSGPRVRIVQFSEDPEGTSLHRDSLITILFDRPLENRDYSDSVYISPKVAFEARTSPQSITLTLKENLSHSTQYTLGVLPNIIDTSNRTMDQEYTYSFESSQPDYIYLERDYKDSAESFTLQDDRLVFGTLNGDSETIYTHPEIIMFAANDKYAVAVSNNGDGDQLHTIDLVTKETRLENWNLSARISDISISDRGQLALFTTVPNAQQFIPSFSDTIYNRLQSLNLETGDIQTVLDGQNQAIRAFSVELETYGQVALIRGPEQLFYFVSPFSDYDPVPIGSFVSSFGFSGDSTRLLFRNSQDFSSYTIADNQSDPLVLGDPNLLQTIRSGSQNTTYYSTLDFTGRSVESTLLKKNGENNQEIIWSSPQNSSSVLRNFEPSFDGRLFALELNPESCFFDDISLNSACTEAQTIVYDPLQNGEVLSVRGFDFMWLP